MQHDGDMTRRYMTKVDWWIGLILICSAAVLVGSALPFFLGPPARSPWGLLVGAFCLAVAAWSCRIPFNTNYEIGPSALVIRSAGFCWRVPLDAITGVAPTRNPLSAPACSLDRLRVNYRNHRGRLRFVLISPREKDDFLRDLGQAVPGLERVDDRLVNAASEA